MRTIFAGSFVVLSACSVVACGGADHHPGAASASTNANIKAPGEAKIGDTSHCPVSGEEFVVAADSPKVEHEGKTYYFCCGGCAKKFKADPAKYVAKLKGAS